jgi:carboxypeptidase T
VGANYTYRNYSEAKADLLWIELHHPAIAKVYDIGDSWEKTQNMSDRDILAIKISDNVQIDESEPEVLVTALHHAREWITTEIAVALAETLTNGYGTDERISWLVDNREIWIVPIVNPDGLDYSLAVDSMWRKNRRINFDMSNGVDLNRNYGGSSNGDPLGGWGGEGSSNTTWDETYRGTGPFSEPETRAVRDLVLSRSFTMALDFHSYGNLVLWPWGYTGAHAPDYTDLSRIGSEIASVNGYTANQSVGLYPTTGDLLDWAYGYADVYPFTIEVGYGFHPANASVVAQSIDRNVNASIQGVEIAGDREERGFAMTHTPSTAEYYQAAYEVEVNATSDRGVENGTVQLVYSYDGLGWYSASMAKGAANDSYTGFLPSRDSQGIIQYYFSARDVGGALKVLPEYAPYSTYTIHVVPPPDLDGYINFSMPQIVDGSDPWVFRVTVVDYPYMANLSLSIGNYSYGMQYLVGGEYSLDVPMMPLGTYAVGLHAYVANTEVYDYVSQIEVADLTSPEFWNVSGKLIGGAGHRNFVVNVACTDFFGVTSATVIYRIDSGEWQSLTQTGNSSVRSRSYWSFEIPIGDREGVIEYRVTTSDSRNSASFPNQDFLEVRFDSVHEGSLILYVAIAVSSIVAIIAIAYVFIRARRPRASGP